jgi:hypothetical protein
MPKKKGTRFAIWVCCLIALPWSAAIYAYVYFDHCPGIFESIAAAVFGCAGIGAVLFRPKADLDALGGYIRDLGPGKSTFGFLGCVTAYARAFASARPRCRNRTFRRRRPERSRRARTAARHTGDGAHPCRRPPPHRTRCSARPMPAGESRRGS